MHTYIYQTMYILPLSFYKNKESLAYSTEILTHEIKKLQQINLRKYTRCYWYLIPQANQPTHVEAALVRTKNTIYNNPVPSEKRKSGGGGRGGGRGGEAEEGEEGKKEEEEEKRDLTAKYYGEHF